ncbi:hypothetical protein [Promicromonospora sp. NPDC050880]|uniref:hypothetical protein n=1 Tax=Promicromonospora sp. NPDC050880 TaxID=3364406 RepID=UPI003794ED2F
MSSENRRAGGLSPQACAVILGVAGMCAWVAHDVLTGTAAASPAAAATAPAGDVYVTTPGAPPADTPPVVLMLAPDGSARPAETTSAPAQAAPAPAAPAPSAGRARTAPSATHTGPQAARTSGAAPLTEPPQAAGTPPRPVRSAPDQGRTTDAAGPADPVVVVPMGRAPRSGGTHGTTYQVLAADGSIVYIGEDGELVANTGAVTSSGVLSLGSDGSSLRSGQSTTGSHQNDTFGGLLLGSAGDRPIAISGFEDHSVSVVGDDQVVTYDDSNVFLGRDGRINANTGDTDSSGLNAVDVTGSVVRSGNSGDAEDTEDEEEDEQEDDEQDDGDDGEDEEVTARQSTGKSGAHRDRGGPAGAFVGPVAGPVASPAPAGQATVTDEGESSATGRGALVVGADGFDDVSVRSRGHRNVVTYDDSNVVIGGTGPVNTQIGDSDTGGAVVMGVHGSDVRAGCEGDLCYSD